MNAKESPVQLTRAEQRKQRLLELEWQQAAEEAEALKLTEVCPMEKNDSGNVNPLQGTTQDIVPVIRLGQSRI